MSRHIATLLLLVTLAAAPATQPITPLTDTNSVVMTSESQGITFRVPKTFKRQQTSGPADEVFVFGPAAPAKVAIKKGQPMPEPPMRSLSLMLGQPCERQKKLQEVVNDTRAGLERMHPGVKFLRDEATTVADHEAWVFAYPDTGEVTITEVVNGKQTVRKEPRTVIRQKTQWLQNDTICDLNFASDPAGQAEMQRITEQVRQSIAWTKKS